MNATTRQPTRQNYLVQARDFSIPCGPQTKLMGIINMTPDSFSQDGLLRHKGDHVQRAVAHALTLIRQGADLLDIGGESTRPGSRRICVKEELARVIPVIKTLCRRVQIPISVDTYKSAVAEHALDAGASVINNIKGIKSEKGLLRMVRNYGAAIVLMHMRATPRTMQKNIVYRDVVKDIIGALKNSIENCLEIGIKLDRIIIDPGIGFGKALEHNLTILNKLDAFQALKRPILIGTSRKSFIGIALKRGVRHRVWGTAASVCVAIMRGAHIVRVHDVGEMKDVTTMMDAIIHQKVFS